MCIRDSYIIAQLFIYGLKGNSTCTNSTLALSVVVTILFVFQLGQFVCQKLLERNTSEYEKVIKIAGRISYIIGIGQFCVWVSVQVFIFSKDSDSRKNWKALWTLLLIFVVYEYLLTVSYLIKFAAWIIHFIKTS
eukprot:TRINITY_DN3470_c0_g1_i3.p1 TRINITY_DN3470_c0_g1~~TRINITY_DN3470_c0_g1_i3.p1  ORF type:complete len:135 (-),score=34.20 TRINITY_DN3470_c0_g1_i3:101-505(-)